MADENRAIWQRIDEHSAVIAQMREDRATDKAHTDARLSHLEQGQARQLELMTRVEAKIDANTMSLSQAQGGIKVGKWIAATLIAVVGLWVAIQRYFGGGG